MRAADARRYAWALLFAQVGCTNPFEASQLDLPRLDGGVCGEGSEFCAGTCCPTGRDCVSDVCTYPYSKAHLYVYLCPSFNTGTCQATFLGLDKACMPLEGSQQGVCYDTGFDVEPSRAYAISSCTKCGSGCGSSGALQTPPGFVAPNYYSGVSWSCGTSCEVPADCGGKASSPTNGVAVCSTFDCWLRSLSLQQGATSVPLTIIPQPAPTPSEASSDAVPSFVSLNGSVINSGGTTISLGDLHGTTERVPFTYEFKDPTACSPGICFSLPRCPPGVRCAAGSITACSHAKRDGVTTGSVIRTLGFKAEPVAAGGTELALQAQLIVGPVDPATGGCTDPIDDADPMAPTFVEGALVGEPLSVTVTWPDGTPSEVPDGGGGPSDAGTADAGSNGICCCDFRTPENMWHCTRSARSGALCSIPWPDCCSQDYTVCE